MTPIGECSALWGEREGGVWCIRVPYTLPFHTCSCNNGLIPSLPHLQISPVLTTGRECLVYSSSPITISRMVILVLYPCGSLDNVMLNPVSWRLTYVNPSQKAPQNVNKPWIICKPDGKVLSMTRAAVVCKHAHNKVSKYVPVLDFGSQRHVVSEIVFVILRDVWVTFYGEPNSLELLSVPRLRRIFQSVIILAHTCKNFYTLVHFNT